MMGLTAFAAYCALFALVFDPKRFLGTRPICLPWFSPAERSVPSRAGSLLSVFGVLLRSPLAMAGAIPIFVLRKLTLTSTSRVSSNSQEWR